MTDNFELDLEGIKASTQQNVLRDGWYWFLARKWSLKTDENTGHRTIQFQLAPMEDPEDIKSIKFPTMFGRLDVADGLFEKKTQANFWYGKTTALASAMFDEVPPLPTKTAGGKWYLNGEPLEKGGYQKAKDATALAVAQLVKDLWDKGEEGIKEFDTDEGALIVAGRVEYYEYTDKAGVAKSGKGLVDLCGELPADAKLVPAGKFIDDGEELKD